MTTEQMWEELLEKCGYREERFDDPPHEIAYYIAPTGMPLDRGIMLTPLTLDNVFEIVVPKLPVGSHVITDSYTGQVEKQVGKCSWVTIRNPNAKEITYQNNELLTALVSALYQAL